MLEFKDNFSVPGKWGYPGTSNNEWVFGELSYDRDSGITLVLQGALRKLEHSLDLRQNLVIPALIGETQNNYYSLFELEGYEQGNSSWTITTLEANFLLRDNQRFINAESAVTGISIGSGFFFPFFRGILPHINCKLGDPDRFEFSYHRKQPIEIINDDWANANFYFKYKGSQNPALSLDFSTTIFLDIEYKKPLTLTKAVEELHFFKDFFLLFSARRICFSDARLIMDDKHGNKIKIDFLCRDKARPFNATYDQSDVTLLYKEIESSFINLFRNWLANRNFNTAGLALFLQVRYVNFPSPIPAFLNMAFALETLHTRIFNHKPFSREELVLYNQLKKEALKKLDDKIRNKVEQCLANVNMLSYADRLRELIDMNSELLKDFIYDKDDFIKRVKNHRNFLAHNHGSDKGPSIPEDAYLYFIAVMRTIFEYAYLKANGLPEVSLAWMHKRRLTMRGTESRVYEIIPILNGHKP